MSLAGAADVCTDGLLVGWTPEPELRVSEWADQHRFLSPKASAEHGQWRTERAPYLREIMDVLSPNDPTERVALIKGSQTGGTECLNNALGYYIDRSPSPILLVLPTVDTARKVSKQRIAPMIEATPILRDRVKDPTKRNSGNTTFVKEFDNGVLMMTGANSGAGLRSMPTRIVLGDEVDAWPDDVDGEGNPMQLAEARTDTFGRRRKVVWVSTPTLRDLSHIEAEWRRSDQRRYLVPCRKCGWFDWIQWRIGGWTGKDGHHHHIRFDEKAPRYSARMVCAKCGHEHAEGFKQSLLARGKWAPQAEGDGTAGFHLSALYSPWKAWGRCAVQFMNAKAKPSDLKVFVNTVLGETWEDAGAVIDADVLLLRAQSEPRVEYEVPPGVGAMTAAVDVQGDRLEWMVRGWGAGEESWLIDFEQLFGSPAEPKVWRDLEAKLAATYKHAGGRKIRPDRIVIDSGGQHTEQVYKFAAAHFSRGVYAIKGGNMSGLPLVQRPTTRNKYQIPLYVLCVDTGKDIVSERLRIPKPGPGYVHLPPWIDREYVTQLTVEKAVRKYDKRRGLVRTWVNPGDKPNEATDLEVYALAALYIMGPRLLRQLEKRAQRWAEPVEDDEQQEQAEKPRRRRRKASRGGWMGGW